MQNKLNPNNGLGRRPGKKKNTPEHSQTVIIPHISKEMVEHARRAAAEGKSRQQIEQEIAAMAQREASARSGQTLQNTRQTPVKTAADAPSAAPVQAPVEDKTIVMDKAPAAAPAPQKPAEPKQPPRAKTGPRTRAEAEAELAQSIHDDHLWLNNPVMVRGLGLAPIVAAASDADNALMLCLAAIMLLTATRVLAVAVCHITGNRFRAMVYCYAAAIIYIPTYIVLYNLFGSSLSVLGIYLPLLVVEPAIVKRMESPELESIGEAFQRGINNTIGVGVSVMLVGMLRELLGAGTVFGNPVLSVAVLPLATETAGGFILVGVIAAVWTAIGGAYVRYKQEEVRHLYDHRKR